MNQSRDLAKELEPIELSENDLVSAIEVLLRNIENTYDVSCEFGYDETVTLTDNSQSVHLYRITQEAINNALKHGKAKNIHIRLNELNGEYVLSVEDDGVGFLQENVKHKGMGLHIMRYRAKAVNGSLDVKRGEDGGVTVTCSLPKGRLTEV